MLNAIDDNRRSMLNADTKSDTVAIMNDEAVVLRPVDDRIPCLGDYVGYEQ
jgi:hypothetical protein